jgi:diguanylate cyclase (GGDEF)-like protein
MNAVQDTLASAPRRAGFGKRVFGWLALVSLIFTAVTAVLFGSISQLISSVGWVTHSYQVIDALDLTEEAFADAQSAERGYVATCKITMISPFRSDLPRIYSEISNLRSLTADNPAQLRRVEALNDAVNAEISRMSTVMAENMRGDLRDAQTALTKPSELEGTHAIFAIIKTMETEERTLLAGRLSSARRNTTITVIASGIGLVACLVILGFLFWLIRHEARRREASEVSLQESNAQLSGSLEELRRYNDAARSIGILGELLQTCRNRDEALGIAARHIEQLLPHASGTIATINPSRDLVEVLRSIGKPEGFAEAFAPEACWALRRGRSHTYHTGSSEPCCDHLSCGGGTYTCLTLSAHSDTLGVLSLHTASEKGFDNVERQTVQTIVEQLSLALANLRLQETLRNQSIRDPLTGLFNRRYMDEALTREIARAQRHNLPVSIAMIDIDHFKRFNDAHGHDGGDALLAAFGRLLAEHARAEDIVCRYGGEEFALILPGATQAVATERLELLRKELKRLEVQSQGRPLGPVTMSAGVAVFPAHGTGGTTVLHVADRALYQAKTEGRDRVVAAPTADTLRGLGQKAGDRARG